MVQSKQLNEYEENFYSKVYPTSSNEAVVWGDMSTPFSISDPNGNVKGSYGLSLNMHSSVIRFVVPHDWECPTNFSWKSIEEIPKNLVVEPGSCFREIEFIGIGDADLKSEPRLIDFITTEVQDRLEPLFDKYTLVEDGSAKDNKNASRFATLALAERHETLRKMMNLINSTAGHSQGRPDPCHNVQKTHMSKSIRHFNQYTDFDFPQSAKEMVGFCQQNLTTLSKDNTVVHREFYYLDQDKINALEMNENPVFRNIETGCETPTIPGLRHGRKFHFKQVETTNGSEHIIYASNELETNAYENKFLVHERFSTAT